MKNLIFSFVLLFALQISVAQKNGPYQENYDNGYIKISGHFENGKRSGEWKEYYDNGKLSKVYSYTDGKINKETKQFFENSKLKFEINKVDGVFISTHYYESGNVLSEQLLKNGYYKEFYEMGELKIKANYRNGDLFGLWTSYFKTGERNWEVEYFNGYKKGFYKQYYKNGQLKIEGVHSKNKKNGTEKRFSESGYLEWKGKYNDDIIDKKWTNFDKEGRVLQTLIFKNGKQSNTDNQSSLNATVVPDGPIEFPPIYPGCENIGYSTSKKCMSDNISAFVAKKFDTQLAGKLGIPKGTRLKILIFFKINKLGDLTDVRAKAQRPELEKEAVRVIKMLPKLGPGFQRGKAVIVPYTLPIIFQVVK